MVLDDGKIIEFDTPKNLYEKSEGIFRGMCVGGVLICSFLKPTLASVLELKNTNFDRSK